MTRLSLDTSAYSAFVRGHPEIISAVAEADEVNVSPVVLGELAAGYARSRFREKNERDLRSFLDSPRVSVPAIDEETSACYALIINSLQSRGKPIPTNDVWIAASAMQHGHKLLTTDRHFTRVGQILVECFEVE